MQLQTMKFYLASDFELKQRVVLVAEYLKSANHSITREWWHYDFKQLELPDKIWYKEHNVVDVSKRNFQAIRECDVFLIVAHHKKARKFNGANIELGYALALGKPCFSLGRLQRSAMYVPVVKCSNINEVLQSCVVR